MVFSFEKYKTSHSAEKLQMVKTQIEPTANLESVTVLAKKFQFETLLDVQFKNRFVYEALK